jgi:hypothetical protein
MTREQPDLVLKLDVPTAVAMHRRPGLDTDYLRARIELVRALEFSCPTVILDSSKPYEAVRADALAAITGIQMSATAPALV